MQVGVLFLSAGKMTLKSEYKKTPSEATDRAFTSAN
jgi:hypothetical protein